MDGRPYRWYLDGTCWGPVSVRTLPYDCDLVYATRKKETAPTAEAARRAMEHNKMVESIEERQKSDALAMASRLRAVLALCVEYDVDIDAVVKDFRDESSKIRMDGKYKTKGGKCAPSFKVRLLCVDRPESDKPVIGLYGAGNIGSWTADGLFQSDCDPDAPLNLVPDDGD